jgi:hypothetical protein
MSFDDFAQLCGVSVPSSISNGDSMLILYLKSKFLFVKNLDRTNKSCNEIDESLKTIIDNRVNCLREDFKEDLNRTKLSMQMNFIVELERLRVN